MGDIQIYNRIGLTYWEVFTVTNLEQHETENIISYSHFKEN